jgi:hypothetical protein
MMDLNDCLKKALLDIENMSDKEFEEACINAGYRPMRLIPILQIGDKVKVIDYSPVFHNKTGVIVDKLPCGVPDNDWWYKVKFDDSSLKPYTFLQHELTVL